MAPETAMRARLLLANVILALAVTATFAQPPLRRLVIPLPTECQHPSRELYSYDGGQRFGLLAGLDSSGSRNHYTVFCLIDPGTRSAQVLLRDRPVNWILPAPHSLRTGMIVESGNAPDAVLIIDGHGKPLVERPLDTGSMWSPAAWADDGSALFLTNASAGCCDDFAEFAIVRLADRSLKKIRLKADAQSLRFDQKDRNIRVEYTSSKTPYELLYDLNGRFLRRQLLTAPTRRAESATRRYYYVPKHEIGEGDTLVRESGTNRLAVRMKEHVDRAGTLWDNPQWNPANDDLILALYWSEVYGPGELRVLSISRKKTLKRFPIEYDNMPAYGWSRDGKQVVMCNTTCVFETVSD